METTLFETFFFDIWVVNLATLTPLSSILETTLFEIFFFDFWIVNLSTLTPPSSILETTLFDTFFSITASAVVFLDNDLVEDFFFKSYL